MSEEKMKNVISASGLIYKTRHGESPSGKAKVYFCSHPDDHPRYFSEVSRDLLRHQDCSIWYVTDRSESPTDDFWFDLSQMSLFVIPITHRFLEGGHRGMEECNFAREHNIPILPLMQEDGLEAQFNRVLGELQFLNKRVNDSTAIGYDEKLKKYLSAVLIGDELSARVRAAFDAYIFLSYRKKDRRQAQRLMNLIHQNEACRDFAIWYDEFLVPGENFNDSILNALKKSELFALAVTPNLINEPNYVMTTEYPLALEYEKPIIPFLMVDTDRALLEEKYPGIPKNVDPVSFTDPDGDFSDLLSRVAIRRQPRDPSHDFFIGLAYLGGIDVEVDHLRAVELITFAAESGLPEAIEQIAFMYRSGNGVKRCGDTAVNWQTRLSAIVGSDYDAERSIEKLLRYTEVLSDLGDLLCEELRFEEAERVYLQIVDLVDEKRHCADGQRIDTRLLHRLANIHISLGGLDANRKKEHYNKEELLSEDIYTVTTSHMHRDSIEWEIAHYTSATELLIELSKIDPTKEIMLSLCRCYLRLGNAYVKGYSWNRALANDYFSKAVKLCRENGPAFSEPLSDAYGGLGILYGNISRERGMDSASHKNSGACFIAAIKTLLKLYGEVASTSLLVKLIDNYRSMAEWCRDGQYVKDFEQTGKWFIQADNYHKQAETVARVLVDKTDAPSDKVLLAICLAERGNTRLSFDDIASAEPMLQEAIGILEGQLADTDMFTVRYYAVECNRYLGELYQRLGDSERAEHYYSRSKELSNCATNWEKTDTLPIISDPFSSF